jgi:hypothetical protein
MKRLRNALFISVLTCLLLAFTANLWLLPDELRTANNPQLYILPALCILFSIFIFLSFQPALQRSKQLSEALRTLARGEKEHRIKPESFRPFEDVARAINEVAASMCEDDDPNIGPIRIQPRVSSSEATSSQNIVKRDVKTPTNTQHTLTAASTPFNKKSLDKDNDKDNVDGGDLGTPRPHQYEDSSRNKVAHQTTQGITKTLSTKKTSKRTINKQSDSTPPTNSSSAAPATLAPIPAQTTQHIGEDLPLHQQDTMVETVRPSYSMKSILPASSFLPDEQSLKKLFLDYVDAHTALDIRPPSTDIETFTDTIQKEAESLILQHQCQTVRFEIVTEHQIVSIRPRLIRHKNSLLQ